MGFRFFKRLNILPGVQLNLSKSGGSMSIGPHGAKLTLGTSGGHVTLGVPGTGLFYTKDFSLKTLGKLFGQSTEPIESQETSEPTPVTASTQTPSLPHPDSPDFALACQALARGDEEEAWIHLQKTTHLADASFLAGVLALKKGQLSDAISYLTSAAAREKELGQHLSQQGVAATLSLAITDELAVHVGPNIRGVLLALAEAYQAQEKKSDAIKCLEQLRELEPSDIVINLSLAELLMDEETPTKEVCQRVVQLTEGVNNEAAVQTTLLLYKAKALRLLGLLDAAQEVLSGALKRKKNRSDELLRALRYERALVYEGQGENRKARVEFEKLYAEAPEYEDVKKRLGL